MANKGFGFELNDIVVIGALIIGGYYVWKLVIKPLSEVEQAGANVASGVGSAVSGAGAFYGDLARSAGSTIFNVSTGAGELIRDAPQGSYNFVRDILDRIAGGNQQASSSQNISSVRSVGDYNELMRLANANSISINSGAQIYSRNVGGINYYYANLDDVSARNPNAIMTNTTSNNNQSSGGSSGQSRSGQNAGGIQGAYYGADNRTIYYTSSSGRTLIGGY